MIERRKFLTGLISLVAAPAIVRAGSLMPVKADPVDWRYVVRRVNIDISEVYGRSPAMMALPDVTKIIDVQAAMARYVQVVWETTGISVLTGNSPSEMRRAGNPVTSAGAA